MVTKGAGAEGARPLCGAAEGRPHIFGIFSVFSALDLYFFCISGRISLFFHHFFGICFRIRAVSPCSARIRTCIFTPILRLALRGIFSVLSPVFLLFCHF